MGTRNKIEVLLFLILSGVILISCRQSGTRTEATVEPLMSPGAAEAQVDVAENKTSPRPQPGATSLQQPVTTVAPALPQTEQSSAGWQRLDTTGGGGQIGLAFHPTEPETVYVASDNGGLFKTENGGDSWMSVSSNLGSYRLGFVALDPLNPAVIYVTASMDYDHFTMGGAQGEIYRSLNDGLVWEFMSDAMGFQSAFPSQTSLVIPYDPTNPGRFDDDGDSLSDIILVGAWTGPANPPVGGIWRSEDEGNSFRQIALDDRNITALYSFEGNTNVLFAATYEGDIYRSEDLGDNWLNITGNMPLSHPADLAVHPANRDILYVTCRPCQAGEPPVWKTTDGGQHWFAASTGLDSTEIGEIPKILIDRFDPNTLYVTTRQGGETAGIYQSTDGGNRWHSMPNGLVLPDGRPYFWFKIDGGFTIGQAIDGRLFTADSGGVWRYPDGHGRQEWEPVTIGIGNIHVNTIEVDPLDDAVLYQGISDFGPYKSTDRGVSFYRILGNGWPVTVRNFVWDGPYYRNYAKCWLSCSSTCQAEGGIGAGGTNDFAISRQNSAVVYSAFGSGSGGSSHGGVNKSTDGGKTWQPLGFQLKQGFDLNPETCTPYGFKYLAIDPTNDDILFAVMEIPAPRRGKLYRTTDGGLTWSEVYSTSGRITGVEVSPVKPDLVVLITGGNVYKSEQGGNPDSWQAITPPKASAIRVIKLSPHQEQVYVIGTNDQGIYYTADGGKSWRNNPLTDFFEQKLYQDSNQFLDPKIATAFNPGQHMLKNVSAIVFDPVVPDTFYIGGTQYARASVGVAKITNSGQNWERLPLVGLDHRNIFDLAVDSSGTFLYAGTFNGTYRLKLR